MSNAPVAKAKSRFLMTYSSLLLLPGPTLQPSRRCARRKISKLLEPRCFFVLAPSFPAESSALRPLRNRAPEERTERKRSRLAGLRDAWAGDECPREHMSACARDSFLTAFTVAADAGSGRRQSLVFSRSSDRY